MKYLFVFLAILVVWTGIIAIAALVPAARGFELYAAAQALTVLLFYIGFYRK